MVSFWNLGFFFIILSVFVNVQTKNYNFEVTYECFNNEFKWYEQKLKHQTIYGCRNWRHKIFISEEKNKFVRFESEQVEELEKIQEEEEQEFEDELQKEEQMQKMEEIEEDEELLKEIEKLEKEEQQEQQEKEMGEEQQKQGNSQLTSESNIQTKDNNPQLTHKLASTLLKSISSDNRHMLSSSYHYVEGQNELRHYFELRHCEEQGQAKQKFKPLKAHRDHPIQDVMFLLEIIEMNSIILERSYQAGYEDVPTLEELEEILEKKKQQSKEKPNSQQEKSQKQHHFLSVTKPKQLRSTNQ